jgi:hypothetical protein
MEPSEQQRGLPIAPQTLGEIGRAGIGTGASTHAGAATRAPDATSPAGSGMWTSTLQWVLAGAITILLMWLTYSRGGWVPLLSGADLAIHEFGHMLTMWAPPLLCSLAGSFLQVAAPLGLTAYFWWRRDRFAVIVMIAWAAESLNNVSVYVGDAQRMVLPLFGDDGSGAGHDWHNILRGAGLLGSTDTIARSVHVASVCLFVLALGLAVLGFVRAQRPHERARDRASST